jgi:hypothetical protein
MKSSKCSKPKAKSLMSSSKSFDALDWLAQLVTHIPNKGEQMVRDGVYPPLAELLLK